VTKSGRWLNHGLQNSNWEKTNPEKVDRPNLNHFCLSTSKKNWESLQKRLEENGISIDEGPAQR
jgi:extradiol dioxygenase family protein